MNSLGIVAKTVDDSGNALAWKFQRIPYTSDDEKQLVKYLTTYNPDGKACKGNALYKHDGRSHAFTHLNNLLSADRPVWEEKEIQVTLFWHG
jgi:hypothetical protein